MPITKTITKAELDASQCSVCGEGGDGDHDHDELVFHSRCHPEAATFAWYKPGEGTLTVKCAECERQIATVEVK